MCARGAGQFQPRLLGGRGAPQCVDDLGRFAGYRRLRPLEVFGPQAYPGRADLFRIVDDHVGFGIVEQGVLVEVR